MLAQICTLNDEKTAIKPNIKAERNTIILRDIPSDTPEDDVSISAQNDAYCRQFTLFCQVKKIFDGQKLKSIRGDVGDTWFVTMETESDAVGFSCSCLFRQVCNPCLLRWIVC